MNFATLLKSLSTTDGVLGMFFSLVNSQIFPKKPETDEFAFWVRYVHEILAQATYILPDLVTMTVVSDLTAPFTQPENFKKNPPKCPHMPFYLFPL